MRPTHQLGNVGEHCELPGGVWGEAPASKSFDVFFVLSESDDLSCYRKSCVCVCVCTLCKCIISLIFVTHVKAIIAWGSQELGGPGSLNCPNPRFLHHWIRDVTCHMTSHSIACHPTQLNAP